jgi:hypothetical protein
MAVLLAGSGPSPRVLEIRRVDLCDPNLPESQQPYHARMGQLEEDPIKIERRTRVVQNAATKSVQVLLAACQANDHVVRAAGLVVGSLIDPATIHQPHIRAHALEGRLFRTVLEAALQNQGLTCRVLIERGIYDRAATALAQSEPDLKWALTRMDRPKGQKWRAEEKLAALAAWMVLANS